MSQPVFQLTVLGTRGSMPICCPDRMIFGGNTSCYMVRAGETTIFLDAGSGLAAAPKEFPQPPAILLSHLHLDHILGLGTYRRLLQKGLETDLYLPFGSSQEGRRILDGVFSPPYWPLSLTEYAGSLRLRRYSPDLKIGEVSVDTEKGSHPGGSLLIRLRFQGKTLVYATDFEHGEFARKKLAAFAERADLLLYDGQFTKKDYVNRVGFGHSTAEDGLEVMRLSGAKQMLLIHHDPQSTDEMLLRREKELGCAAAHYAREGETITI